MLHECYLSDYSSEGLRLAFTIASSVPYIFFVIMTVCRYRTNLIRINRCLLYSWAVESIFRIILGILNYVYSTFLYVPDLFFQPLDYANTVVFVLIIFRLKAVEIYMDENNKTADDISRELTRLRNIRLVYGIAFAVTLFDNSPFF